jgi:hypothetical protein
VSLSQTEKVPAPAALDGVVVSDITTRSLGVRLPETASGYQRLWWKQAHQQLKAAVEDGWSRHPYVWASTPSAYRAVHVQPADFAMLQVTFPVGTAGYSELISRPGLYAIATVDRNSNRFLAVKFLHRP